MDKPIRRAADARLLKTITNHYLGSDDFNGFPLRSMAGASRRQKSRRESLTRLVAEGAANLNFGDRHPNPHIQAFPPEATEVQLEKLVASSLEHVCAYPSASHLASVVDASEYAGRPFTLRLARGEPQLGFASFDLSVLEIYRNDPRYTYTNDDIQGNISVHDQYYESNQMHERDQVLLQTFGFSYDEQLNRAVAVFLKYLGGLSPEHQQIWSAKILAGDFTLHRAYVQTAIMGEWQVGIPICEAILEEIKHINTMCDLIGRPHLFLTVWGEGQRPREFGLLIRPTLREFNAFVLLLDKLISQNLDKRFFLNDVPLESDEVRKDGTVVVRQKGTLQILCDWFDQRWRLPDRAPVDEMLAAFQEVRRIRQRPAHAVDDDRFDQSFIKQQRDVLVQVYGGLRTLRLLFMNHPRASGYSVPADLQEGEIYTY